MAYVQHRIEWTDESGQVHSLDRDAEVDSDTGIPGYDELVEGGSIADEPWDPELDKPEPPQYVEIDGVRYERQEPTDA